MAAGAANPPTASVTRACPMSPTPHIPQAAGSCGQKLLQARESDPRSKRGAQNGTLLLSSSTAIPFQPRMHTRFYTLISTTYMTCLAPGHAVHHSSATLRVHISLDTHRQSTAATRTRYPAYAYPVGVGRGAHARPCPWPTRLGAHVPHRPTHPAHTRQKRLACASAHTGVWFGPGSLLHAEAQTAEQAGARGGPPRDPERTG